MQVLVKSWQVACLLTLIAATFCCLVEKTAYAQDNYEIQVYGADTVAPKTTMLELHSNFTTKSGVDLGADQYSTLHALHETLEITHGFTSFFELGYYNFTSIQPGVNHSIISRDCTTWLAVSVPPGQA